MEGASPKNKMTCWCSEDGKDDDDPEVASCADDKLIIIGLKKELKEVKDKLAASETLVDGARKALSEVYWLWRSSLLE